MSAFHDVLDNKAWRILSDLPEIAGMRDELVEEIVCSVEAVCGKAVARGVASEGLAGAHRVMPADDVRAVAADFAERCGHRVQRGFMAAARALDIAGRLVVHAAPTLRIVFPFEEACRARIRLADYLAGLAEPVQSPDPLATARYHNDLPMAAWTHGPHVDSWWGQPFGGLNFWMAVAGVSTDSGLIFFDALGPAGGLRHDREPPYVMPGQPLPVPSRPDMANGDVLIFDPEILHATQVNVSAQTRVSLATRINVLPLRFDSSASRRHSHWLDGDRLDAPPLDFGAMCGADVAPDHEARNATDAPRSFGETTGPVNTAALPDEGERVVGTWHGEAVVLVRLDGEFHAYFDQCPHGRGRLSDIPVRDGKLTCASHGMRYGVADGQGVCGAWSLRVIAVEQTETGIRLVRRRNSPSAVA